ncbi:MAG: GAF domain-containing protein, partial [Acidobacteriaceae bacterium]
MKPRKKTLSPGLLRFLLILWILASLGYWIAQVADLWQVQVHWDQRVQVPFHYDPDSRLILPSGLQPEAAAAGLAAGDRVEQLNGTSYTGKAQWQTILAESHPGDILDVGFSRPGGAQGSATLTLVRTPPLHTRLSPLMVFWESFFVLGLLSLVCLLTGYWVVFARPSDRNAWLALVLLSFPSVLFNPGMATGIGLFLQEFWFQTIQLAGAPALLLFGIYFPERSRIDARARWVKWIMLAVFAVCCAFLYPSFYMQYYGGGDPPFLMHATNVAADIINFLNLIWALLFIFLALDKVRSASTADARRRMRVLSTGMGIGVGALLIVFVLLAHLGITLSEARYAWLRYIGLLLFMLAPLTLAYVVLVQRALDVRVLLRMGTRYALAKATLWVVQAALISAIGIRLLMPVFERRQPQASDILAAAVFLVVVLALRFGVSKRLQQWLDRQFFREAYNAEVMLNELSDEVRHFTETQPLLETVARTVRDTLHIRQIALLLRHGDAFRLEQAVGISADGTLTLPAQASSIRYLANSSEPARLYRSDPDAWYLMAGTAERKALDLLNAELLIPLPGRNRLMGIMALGPKRSEAAWSRTDLQVLQTVARQTGLALEVSELAHSLATEAAQRERTNREMEIAREVQERLFPQEMPAIAGGSVAGACRP